MLYMSGGGGGSLAVFWGCIFSGLEVLSGLWYLTMKPARREESSGQILSVCIFYWAAFAVCMSVYRDFILSLCLYLGGKRWIYLAHMLSRWVLYENFSIYLCYGRVCVYCTTCCSSFVARMGAASAIRCSWVELEVLGKF